MKHTKTNETKSASTAKDTKAVSPKQKIDIKRISVTTDGCAYHCQGGGGW